jgi:CheY-like chemotaxis protein
MNKKILIVEDEISMVRVLADKFQDEGFHVVVARNGVEGYQMAAAEHPDLMLVDVLMPGMDGLTMLKKIKQDDQLKKIPAIILTNVNDTQTTAEALANGVYDYLVKTDWELPDLVKLVKEKLERPRI